MTQSDTNRFPAYFAKLIAKSPLTQRELADAVGYPNQNMITMLKQGRVKLTLDRVPAMAKALGVDPLDMFKVAITQSYDPAAVKLLLGMIEQSLSQTEREILSIAREAAGDEIPALDDAKRERLREVFS